MVFFHLYFKILIWSQRDFEMDPKGVRDEIQARCWREEFER
jgi:hypothetical protein